MNNLLITKTSRKKKEVYLVYNLGLIDDDEIFVFETKKQAEKWLKEKMDAKKDFGNVWLAEGYYGNMPYKIVKQKVK